MDFSYSGNHVSLPQGDFMTNVISSRMVYSISRDMFAKSFLQWNDSAEILSLNLLYNFYYRSGSNIYIVFNQFWDFGNDVFDARDRAVLMKLDYWLNL